MNVRFVGTTVMLCAALAVYVLATAGDARPGASGSIRVWSVEKKGYLMTERVTKSDEDWKKLLTPEQFKVTRRKGTERAFDNAYWNNHEKGV